MDKPAERLDKPAERLDKPVLGCVFAYGALTNLPVFALLMIFFIGFLLSVADAGP